MLRANGAADDRLHGAVDPTKVAVAGLSLGGATTLLAAYDDCCADTRYKAAVAMSPIGITVQQGGVAGSIGGTPPILLMHGTADPVLPYSGSEALFAASKPGTDFVTLNDAVHAAPYEDDPSAHDQFVIDATVADLDAVLDYHPGSTVSGRDRFLEVVGAASNVKIASK